MLQMGQVGRDEGLHHHNQLPIMKYQMDELLLIRYTLAPLRQSHGINCSHAFAHHTIDDVTTLSF